MHLKEDFLRRTLGSFLSLLFFIYLFSSFLFAEEAIPPSAQSVKKNQSSQKEVEPPKPANIFAQTFLMDPSGKLDYEVYEIKGFVFVKTPDTKRNTNYSIVTGFAGQAIKSQIVPNLQTIQEAKEWIEDNLKTAEYEGVEIRQLDIPMANGKVKSYYWVGNKAFNSPEQAQAQITLLKSLAEVQGTDFKVMVVEAQTYIEEAEKAPPVDIEAAQYAKEEKLVLALTDQMNIGTKLFGPFQGWPSGEPVIWQSFGETSYRMTNLEAPNFNGQVGFWTNRLVFKGIRAPLNTIDPFVEVTPTLESNGADFKSNAKFWAGFEWRPLQRNPFLYNFRPWGGIAILEWMRNWRLYVQYGDRKNLKDQIVGSDSHNLVYGAQIFYEWGVEVPPLWEKSPTKFSEYVEQYVWGEYFGNYAFETTNFGPEEDFDAWILNSNIMVGIKWPRIPLPQNPINDELILMPYMRFEQTSNTEFSFPYQNQYFIGAGLRIMPFRTWRFKENDWLAKTKLFVEWVGVGNVQNFKGESSAPRYDLRVGMNFSHRRY